MKLTLVTPEKKLVTDFPIDEIYIPGFAGELNILPGHAPLITTLEPGILRYRATGDSKTKYVAVSWGYCEIHSNAISILAETAEFPEEIELARAEEARVHAGEVLAAGNPDPIDFEKTISKLKHAEVRIQVFDKRTDTRKLEL